MPSGQALICAGCGHEGAAAGDECSECGKNPLLDGRYRLLGILGQGAFGTTWRGERVEDGRAVCLKELLYQRLVSFEPERLFEREAAVLRQLDLDGVPEYIDDFTVVAGRAVSMFLVQELVDGETLASEMEDKRYREEEVLDILEGLLVILRDLHTLSPPVIHRDIKPANVMRRSDGELMLIDFGAVKDVLQSTQRSTPSVVGTIGFMSPEQLRGKAEPATDLFGAGALAVALLSRRDPADLLDDDGRLEWESHVSVRPEVVAFLAALLHPSLEARTPSAQEALEDLKRLRQPPVVPQPRALREPEPRRALPPKASQPAVVQNKSYTRVFLAVAGGIVGVSVLAAVLSDESSSEDPAATPPSYAVPTGILDLRLGMSLEETKAVGTEIATGREGTLAPPGAGLRGGEDESLQLPGPVWSFSTTIVGQAASCRLEFAVDEGLSRIGCVFAPFKSASAFDAAIGKLQQQLEERYSLPAAGVCADRDPDAVTIGVETGVACEWSGTSGVLALRGEFSDLQMFGIDRSMAAFGRNSSLLLSLSSAAHARRVDAAKRRDAAAKSRDEKAARAARQAAEAAERQRIEEAASRGL